MLQHAPTAVTVAMACELGVETDEASDKVTVQKWQALSADREPATRGSVAAAASQPGAAGRTGRTV